MDDMDLEDIAKALVAPSKGILAADESTGTIKKRLDTINTPSTEDTRRDYRELLLSSKGAGDYISGVILYDETLRQQSKNGGPLTDLIMKQGIIPGIKVDTGAKPLAFSEGELVTEGLDGLRDRLNEYHKLGARFAKWRAVISIGDSAPSQYCIDTNAHALARYAALCQEAGIVPIVEPEVMMDGDHNIDECYAVTETTLKTVFDELYKQRVVLEQMLLKPNMVISGKDCPEQASVEEVATKTLYCFEQTVPAAVPGIVFLSGGQSEQQATEHLNAMNKMGKFPWEISYSFGRALQASALATWQGKAENVEAAQNAFLHRAKLTSAARDGEYSSDME
ncbi:class I fructose-bisphosphate aldolase [Sneathiella sp. HT1-7]|jgi:fructose-bisphosphate aldolase class I|uniref:class I fructose-bisphosphate aldolase n=1 Tax=Sneathiella sp. HT1-7 TaxID=2887192 RepID=UPI001D156E34|nr:class I fructose-bisphosphate aldolase [Sneathiella sp. HT1-7]MCC3305415.1 fructose-bisphosphate aldolase class I [Sneathiella sp. HT1-7]